MLFKQQQQKQKKDEFNDDFNVDEKPKLKKGQSSPARGSARRADPASNRHQQPASKDTKSSPVKPNPVDTKSKTESNLPNDQQTQPQQQQQTASSVSSSSSSSTSQLKSVAHVSSKVVPVNTSNPIQKNEEDDDEDINSKLLFNQKKSSLLIN